ncbi:MAG: electron transport complex subunit RsxA [Bacteroidetes bacterium GWF2_43_63]|nr:MAG: electron transport complex subunit RsxA [Bacteroidetes bacterium GWE2_42_42]OFY53827.1 MAG: electron transport complex subunit RsxA [Bacteroidetes bacterium GWF2_43_63]HBG69783.1 electron transport complex subunit RsxA [Bacteroidales bacterium]HCB61019.1 electron transport complex subunit RsxA [Bacteroidales bacterium]HCY24575.1 electron transport complex subunit RsxA [Bacteroidales bacterium]
MEYIVIVISAIFVSNIIFAQFLGVCPFLGVSKKISTAVGMGGAVVFVMTLATLVTYLIQVYVLDVFSLQYLQTIVFILVIASLVQMVEIILKKMSPPLYQALGIFLPLITTNCAVLGVAIMVITKEFVLGEALVFAVSTAIGFTLALVIFAGIREQLDLMGVPKGMRGIPIALVVAGILSLAFMGFANLV